MSRSRVGLGRRGEELAARALARQGYEIMARNWRCEAGEVDIVARYGEVWAFVEVRTRRGAKFGTPEESLTPAKQARMVAVAEHYLAEHKLGEVDWRLDLVAVELDPAGRLVRVEVLENVVEGPL
ncbi:MAG TPA: YraN family protein [Anaerolineae bacterium]|nr:YraN family protein [Anaerolineae bacterium]